jgi:hypothetical protein
MLAVAKRTVHATRMSTHTHISQQHGGRRMKIDRGLIGCAVDLAVLTIQAILWSGGRLFVRFPAAAALTHFQVPSKRVHVETKDAMHMMFTKWHGMWYAENEWQECVTFQKECPQPYLAGKDEGMHQLCLTDCRTLVFGRGEGCLQQKFAVFAAHAWAVGMPSVKCQMI